MIKNKIKNRLKRKSDEKKLSPGFHDFKFSHFTVKIPLLTKKNIIELVKKIINANAEKLIQKIPK